MAEDNLKKALWSEKFDGLTAPKSNWEVVISDNNTTLRTWDQIKASTGINKIRFENGKLVLVKQQQFTGSDDIRATIPVSNITMPTMGYVTVSFDYTQDIEWGSKDEVNIAIKNTEQEDITKLCFGSPGVGLIDTTNLPAGDLSQQITLDTSLYVGKTVHIEIVYCIADCTYNVYYTPENGIRTKAPISDLPITGGAKLDFWKINIQHRCTSVSGLSPVTACYDNLEIVEYASVSQKLTAVADKIRKLSGMTGSLTLDGMASTLQSTIDKGNIVDKVIDGSVQEISNSNATTVRQFAFYCQENLKTAKFQNAKTCYDGAFTGCSALQRVELPSVIGIYGGVFASTPYLKSVIIGTNECDLPSVAAFENCGMAYENGVTIYVPDSALNAYKNATNWSYYASHIKPVSELEG